MKRTALFLAAAAMALTSTVASAQSYGGYRNNNDRGYNGRNDNRGAQNWQRGQRLDQRYRGSDRYVSDYSRYRLSAPPRGYRYYRQDNGDILLAAIASGLIASVIAGNSGASGYNSGYGSGYGAYGYGEPSYGGGYGAGGQVYYDAYGRAYTIDRYGRSVWVR